MPTSTMTVVHATVLAFALITPGAGARTIIYVDDDALPGGDGGTWGSAFTYLQDALYQAVGGVEIRVAGGLYVPDRDESGIVTPGDRLATFQLVDGVALRGGYAGPADPGHPDRRNTNAFETILTGDLGDNDGPGFADNGENAYHVLTGDGAWGSAILDGCTVTGGNADDDDLPHDAGGGIRTQAGAPTIVNCVFKANSATFGGGMENFAGGNPSVSGCRFVANRATFRGGGVHNNQSHPTFTDCVFRGNVGVNSGGGMRNWDLTGLTLIRCRFIDNHAGFGGGMVNDETFAHLRECVFRGNTAEDTSGGLHNWISSPDLVNCLFVHNSAVTRGAAILSLNNSNPLLANCTITANDAGFEGGGLFGSASTATQLTSCIVWGNPGGASGGPGALLVAHSNIQGGWTGTGNIDADPRFRDPAGSDVNDPIAAFRVEGDFRLMPDSPCIDTGNPNHEAASGETDLDGRPRFLCGRIDMGAYEFGIGDYDCSRHINLDDFAAWARCMTGPEGGLYPSGCEAFDFDADGRVTLRDVGGFQSAIAGG